MGINGCLIEINETGMRCANDLVYILCLCYMVCVVHPYLLV